MAFSYEFVDNGKSFNINFGNQEYTAGKNDVELVISDKSTDEILEIRSNSAQFTTITVNVVTDTITGIGAGSSTATELRDALEAIFFLDDEFLSKTTTEDQTVVSNVEVLGDFRVGGELFTQGNSVVVSDTIAVGGSNELLILENMLNGKQSYFAVNTITDGVSDGTKIVEAFDPFEKTDPQGQQQTDDSETFSSTPFVDDLTGETKHYISEVFLSLSDIITYEWFIRSLTGITNGYIKAWIGEVTDPNTEKPNWKTNTTKQILNKENLVTNVGGAGIDIPFLLGKSYFQKSGDTLSFIIIADNAFTLQGATFASVPPFSTEIPYILAMGTNWKLTELVEKGRPIDQVVIGEFASQTTQEPTGLGQANSIVVNYGVGGNTIDDEFTIDNAGVITCNKNSIQYDFELILRMSRSGAGGVSELLARMMYAPDGINFIQVGDSFGARVDNANTVWREFFTLKFSPAVGSKLFLELARNNGVNDSGGLGTFQPTGDLSGWNPVNSVELKISKNVIQ